MSDGTCSVDGGPRGRRKREWCGTHYQRWRKYGDPLGRPNPKPERFCTVDGCGTGGKLTRGWCIKHYYAWLRYGDPLGKAGPGKRNGVAPRVRVECSIDGCTDLDYAHGWCSKHWQRWRKTGDPLATKVIMGDDEARFWSKVNR